MGEVVAAADAAGEVVAADADRVAHEAPIPKATRPHKRARRTADEIAQAQADRDAARAAKAAAAAERMEARRVAREAEKAARDAATAEKQRALQAAREAGNAARPNAPSAAAVRPKKKSAALAQALRTLKSASIGVTKTL